MLAELAAANAAFAVIKQAVSNGKEIAGVQIQPYGGIFTLDPQDFTYD